MDSAMQWGIDLILWIQAHRTPGLDALFRAITQLGGQLHMFIVPALLWCLSYRFGSRLLLTLLLSALVNFALKDLCAQPRPFDMDPRIGPDREMGYGIPSGHAQHTAVEWAGVAAWVARPWLTVVAAVLITLIGFSRIYLGVHFPTDVLAGWAIAGLIVWIYLRHGEALAARVLALGAAAQIALAASVSLLFLLFYAAVPKTPYLVGTGGLFFGSAAGMVICAQWLRAPEGGAPWQRLLRYPVGMIPLLLWASASGKWVPDDLGASYFLITYLNLAVAGLWLTAGAPAVFQATRLTPR